MSPGDVRLELADSLAGVFRYHSDKSEKRIRATIALNAGPRVAEGRSQVVDTFARSGCDWLWLIDSDMAFEEDALERLLKVAYSHDNARIVGGLCFGGRHDRPMFPTVYELVNLDDGTPMTKIVYDYPRDAIVKVGATGAAFLLIHKSVFVEMKKAFGTLANGQPNPYPWFVEAGNNGHAFGEDIAFCFKAQALGIPVYVDTGCKIRHVKTWELCEATYDDQQALAGRTVREVVDENNRLRAELETRMSKSPLTLP